MAWQDSENGVSLNETNVSAGDPTKASDYNKHADNFSLARTSFAKILPGSDQTTPAVTWEQESGYEFFVWRTFDDGDDDVILVDVSEYGRPSPALSGGIVSDEFRDNGFKGRILIIQGFINQGTSPAQGDFVPSATATAFATFDPLKHFQTYMWDGMDEAGNDWRSVVIGTSTVTFKVDAATGNLTADFDDSSGNDGVLVCWVVASPKVS